MYNTRQTFVLQGQVFTKPSMTVPGMTLSLSELLARYVRGESVMEFPGQYVEDDMIPDDLERLDEQDRIMLARDIHNSLNSLQYKQKPGPAPVPEPPKPLPAQPDSDMNES